MSSPYRNLVIGGFALLIVVLIGRRIIRKVREAMRRRRPAVIHPNLQRYNQDYAELDRQRREDAAKIIATSTGNRLAGYRIVRQVEAVFVDGFRTPEDALIALKAAAAQRGANAILNVATQRTAAGKCSASGDAIVASAPLERPIPKDEGERTKDE